MDITNQLPNLDLAHRRADGDLALSESEQPPADLGPRHPAWTMSTGYVAPPRPEDLVQFSSRWKGRAAQNKAEEIERDRQQVRDHYAPNYYARHYVPPVEDPQAEAIDYANDWDLTWWLGHAREQGYGQITRNR